MRTEMTTDASLVDWQELNLRQQVAQTLVINTAGSMGIPEDEAETAAFLEQYPVGGIFVGGEVIEDGRNELGWVRDRVIQVKAHAHVPLLVSADLENGGGDVIPGLTPLPYPMALGAANDTGLAYAYGQACAREGALADINWALAPMADLNLHPLSSNVGPRSFGDEAERVGPLVNAFIAGMQYEGMAACSKTFPGDGSDYRDQHLVTTANLLSMEDWWASYGKVFQANIDAGVATIMTGHLTFPAYQQHREAGHTLPATICPELTTRLLKQEMGFDGLVVTDAYGMGGILNPRDRINGAVEAFAAGADMLLWPDPQYIDRVVAKIEAGEIPLSRLEDALTRIWRVKERYCTPIEQAEDAIAFAKKVAHDTARAALTLLWNRNQRLPLKPQEDKRILLVGTTPHDKAFSRYRILADGLKARGFQVEMVRNITPQALSKREPHYDVLLFCIERQFHRPLGPMELFGEHSRNLWAACTSGRTKTVAVGFGSPYLVPWYFENAPAALNAYSAVPACQEAVAAALCGETDCPGTSPVAWEGRTCIRDLSFLSR